MSSTTRIFYKVTFGKTQSYDRTRCYVTVGFYSAESDAERFNNLILTTCFSTYSQTEDEIQAGRSDCPSIVHPSKWDRSIRYSLPFQHWTLDNHETSVTYGCIALETYTDVAKLLKKIDDTCVKYELFPKYRYDCLSTWLEAFERLKLEQLQESASFDLRTTGNRSVYNPHIDQIRLV